MRFSLAVAAAAFVAGASATGKNYLGFNSGSTLADRSAKFKADFTEEFTTAQKLKNAPGKFNAVRLYTNIQAYSEEDPIEAFEAAIDTNTFILLGVWASGTDNIDKELSALKTAVSKYGKKFTDQVIGISIGSEDLYRVSVTGIKNKSGAGNSPDAIIGFIQDFKKAFQDTPLASIPVGHVDTWDVWTNSTNNAVIEAVDWIGVDEYPYYENGKGNDIKNAGVLFDKAYDATLAVAGDKPVWVTETGWPCTGETWDLAVASIPNAKYYWDEVGCRRLFNKTPTFWYNLRDSNPDNEMKFAITKNLSPNPFFDLTCPTTFDTPDITASPTATSGPKSTMSKPAPSATSSSDDDTSDTDWAPASASTSADPDSGAASAGAFSVLACGALALVAGVFTLL